MAKNWDGLPDDEVREALEHLDGTVTSAVAFTTGLTPEELESLGGVE